MNLPRGCVSALKLMCTPGMGVNLWGESPLYVNPASVLLDICTSTSRRQGRNREGPSGGSRSAKRMSRRTETAYKAESPGKSARHDKAPGSGDTVNAAVASRKFTFLSGEICPTGIRFMSLLFGSLNEAHLERDGQATEPYHMNSGAPLGVIPEVIGQKSAEAIVAKRLL